MMDVYMRTRVESNPQGRRMKSSMGSKGEEGAQAKGKINIFEMTDTA